MAGEKPEVFIESDGEAGIANFEELARVFPRWADRAINSALSSEGYRLLNILKASFDRGGPPGRSWEKLHPYTMRLRKGYRNRPRKRRPKWITGAPPKTVNPLLKFKGGLRYRLWKDENLMSVGFVKSHTDKDMLRMLAKQRRGYSMPVTREMQKLFFALGMPISAETKRLTVPGRPLIGPVIASERERLAANLERKFFANMDRYANE